MPIIFLSFPNQSGKKELLFRKGIHIEILQLLYNIEL